MLFATAAVAGLFVAGGSANASAHADQTNAQTQQVTTTQVVSNHKYVVVKSGDTLWSISKDNHVSLHALRAANKRESTDLIYAGEKLVLPNSSVKKVVTKRAAQPAQSAQTTQSAQPAAQPAQTTQSAQSAAQPAQNTQNVQAANTQKAQPAQPARTAQPAAQPAANNGGSAKEWIAQHESSGSYTASNGNYYGRYQLSSSMLHGDYSAANQERVANQYVSGRYGSWSNAKSFWMQNGWY